MNKQEKIMAVQARLMPGFNGKAIAFGNTKLPDTHAIFNLSSAEKCPSAALGMCAVCEKCYAKKCEGIYPNYLEKNRAMDKFMETATEDDIFELISVYVESAPESKKITHLRLNEAGDFRDQEQVQTISNIAKRLREKYGITTYGWSARTDLDFRNTEFILNGSSNKVLGASKVFKATPKKIFDAFPKGSVMKCLGNCRHCHLCHNDKFHGIIYCREH